MKPRSSRSVVVLPDPVLPRNPNVSPALTSKDKSRITRVSPKSILKSLICINGRGEATTWSWTRPPAGVGGRAQPVHEDRRLLHD